MPQRSHTRPVIGITADIAEDRYTLSRTYARCVAAATGIPLILPCIPSLAERHAALCDGVILSGGDDPATEPFGESTHPQAVPIHPDRQAYELALLDALCDHQSDVPVLGVCLGMQLMALHAGGRLDQHLPDDLPTHADHHSNKSHTVSGELASGIVESNHHQAVSDPGLLHVVARAHDGIIEAVRDPARVFYLGVQWHPERTRDSALGQSLFEQLIAAC
ncbi:MAG: gamma-glutamyl-gamma-aminobutyrate hydrolase family protein [Phycisphaerales bacterium]|nr:gamma-glutamyl-gamma-aminobutyrate hydrolase family protein [Phycisphaerales bacterium]